MTDRYFEDFEPGQRLVSGTIAVSAADIVAFARQFDPQPMHLDDAAARATLFAGLAGSGWHIGALTMRLMVDLPLLGGTPIIGTGVEELRWLQPLRPGDVLAIEAVVLERRPSSKPDRGYLRFVVTTLRVPPGWASGATPRDPTAPEVSALARLTCTLLVPRREGAASISA